MIAIWGGYEEDMVNANVERMNRLGERDSRRKIEKK